MKCALAIAGENALPSAFVVFRGFSESMRKASALGYDGVELALKTPDEIERKELGSLLKQNNLSVSCISTGQVYASLGYAFTDTDAVRRKELYSMFTSFVDIAADYGQQVNIGRVRGALGEKSQQEGDELFIDMASKICSYAEPKGVTLVLEPVNRYEIDYINSVDQGVQLLKKASIPNLKLMPDVFHMNIEDVDIAKGLKDNIDDINYIHLADSNRLAPGDGHINFEEIFDALKETNYSKWCSVEILPYPNPDVAAERAIKYLRNFM
ncbi:MAG: sugar phosphate isomerase/epimerase [Sphaerochaetaceae bacterium]|nr:sugar phosphate isomerase/epimerase [Sphaerochaetaceae bacterium]